ncbi:MAG: hypothetical protein Q6363_001500 [Candidatus Njordarchaeota archaeon]
MLFVVPSLTTVHLVASHRVFLSSFIGGQVRAVFFRILGDSEVVVRLHDISDIAPSAVRSLYLVNKEQDVRSYNG